MKGASLGQMCWALEMKMSIPTGPRPLIWPRWVRRSVVAAVVVLEEEEEGRSRVRSFSIEGVIRGVRVGIVCEKDGGR
jgi:hypothetical protein